jgi:hypothetical protein
MRAPSLNYAICQWNIHQLSSVELVAKYGFFGEASRVNTVIPDEVLMKFNLMPLVTAPDASSPQIKPYLPGVLFAKQNVDTSDLSNTALVEQVRRFDRKFPKGSVKRESLTPGETTRAMEKIEQKLRQELPFACAPPILRAFTCYLDKQTLGAPGPEAPRPTKRQKTDSEKRPVPAVLPPTAGAVPAVLPPTAGAVQIQRKAKIHSSEQLQVEEEGKLPETEAITAASREDLARAKATGSLQLPGLPGPSPASRIREVDAHMRTAAAAHLSAAARPDGATAVTQPSPTTAAPMDITHGESQVLQVHQQQPAPGAAAQPSSSAAAAEGAAAAAIATAAVAAAAEAASTTMKE